MSEIASGATVPLWAKVALGFEAAISALFLAMGWSHTASLAQGRPIRLIDVAALSLPLVLVLLFTFMAVRLCRKGKRDMVGLCVIAPWPLALMAFSLLGAI